MDLDRIENKADETTVYIYDEEGNELGQFNDPNLAPTVGYFTCMDYDKYYRINNNK